MGRGRLLQAGRDCGVRCFSLVPGMGAVTHAGTAPPALMLSIPLSPSCSLAVLQCKSLWRGFKQGTFLCRGSNRTPCNILLTFCGVFSLFFGSLLFDWLVGFFGGFGPFFVVWFAFGYGLQSTHKCISAVVMLYRHTGQVPRERLMKRPQCYHAGRC